MVICLSCPLAVFVNEEELDASVPLQVSEDMVEDDVSSRYNYYNWKLIYL